MPEPRAPPPQPRPRPPARSRPPSGRRHRRRPSRRPGQAHRPHDGADHVTGAAEPRISPGQDGRGRRPDERGRQGAGARRPRPGRSSPLQTQNRSIAGGGVPLRRGRYRPAPAMGAASSSQTQPMAPSAARRHAVRARPASAGQAPASPPMPQTQCGRTRGQRPQGGACGATRRTGQNHADEDDERHAAVVLGAGRQRHRDGIPRPSRGEAGADVPRRRAGRPARGRHRGTGQSGADQPGGQPSGRRAARARGQGRGAVQRPTGLARRRPRRHGVPPVRRGSTRQPDPRPPTGPVPDRRPRAAGAAHDPRLVAHLPRRTPPGPGAARRPSRAPAAGVAGPGRCPGRAPAGDRGAGGAAAADGRPAAGSAGSRPPPPG